MIDEKLGVSADIERESALSREGDRSGEEDGIHRLMRDAIRQQRA